MSILNNDYSESELLSKLPIRDPVIYGNRLKKMFKVFDPIYTQ